MTRLSLWHGQHKRRRRADAIRPSGTAPTPAARLFRLFSAEITGDRRLVAAVG
jgi:hypothetical protein